MEEMGKKIDLLSNRLLDLRLEIWKTYTLFTWQWWMLLGTCILMLVLFFIFIKKDRLLPSVAFLGLINIISCMAFLFYWINHWPKKYPIF